LRAEEVLSPSVGSGDTNLQSDTHLGHVKKSSQDSALSGQGQHGRNPGRQRRPTAPLLAAIKEIISDVLPASKTAFADAAQLNSGEMTAFNLFSSILAVLRLLGLERRQTVFNAMMSALGAIASTI
jgi:hypothetical protein